MPVVARLLFACELLLAHCLQLLPGAIAMVGRTALEQHGDDATIAWVSLRRKKRPFISIELEPAHPVQYHADGFLRGPLPIRVLDAQDELAAVMARIQPRKQRGTHTADMQHAGGARGKTGDDSHFVISR